MQDMEGGEGANVKSKDGFEKLPDASKEALNKKTAIDAGDQEAELLSRDLTDFQFEQIQIEQIDAYGKKMYYDLRQSWSHCLLFWISGLILFNIFLTICVGQGIINFEDKKWFITAITVETFLQTVGMGYIAVTFLFSHIPEKSVESGKSMAGIANPELVS